MDRADDIGIQRAFTAAVFRFATVVLACFVTGSAPRVALSCTLVSGGGATSSWPYSADDWNPGTDCSLSYFNACTGWILGVPAVLSCGRACGTLEYGVRFESCSPPESSTTLEISQVYVLRGAPAGYGFTGTISVFEIDANACPTGEPIASQPWLPGGDAGDGSWQTHEWGPLPVPDRFVIMPTHGSHTTRALLAADGAHSGGPPTCGTCYPTTRVSNTFCIIDGVCEPVSEKGCDVELLLRVGLNHGPPISTESSSWARIKGTYQ